MTEDMLEDILKQCLYDTDSDEAADDGQDEPQASGRQQPEQASPARTSHIREDMVRLVKERLKKGFYNSEPVLEDLSHEFARALNQRV